MTDTDAAPIKLDTGEGIDASATRQKHASGGEQHQMVNRKIGFSPLSLRFNQTRSGNRIQRPKVHRREAKWGMSAGVFG
ncbi:MAG: hypothetical protein O7D31_05370 [Alphaproteobacteria bacterium]|nr:hypothetical protein [Alphaproteobacteria bacterium]